MRGVAVAEPVFEGVGVALATLFDEAGEVDVSATADHARRLSALGVRAVVVAGSTGEAAALDPGERVALLEGVRAALPPGVPVLAGTGGPSARQAVRLTGDAVAHGADALLVLSPPVAGDPRPYYRAVVEAAGTVPVLAYHFPRVSAPGIDVAALAGLPVAGLKDSSGDPDRLLATLEAFDRPVYVGSSALLTMAGAVGAAGAILALANVDPEGCVAAFHGDGKAQRALTAAHLAAMADFPRSLKALMSDRFATSPAARLG
jgi:4-hydroxy-tetrahydrodipicolinate synthase